MSTESTDITGRDAYIIRKALAYAIEAIDRLPPRWREESDREDMTTLLGAYGDADAHRLNARQHLTGRDNNASMRLSSLGTPSSKRWNSSAATDHQPLPRIVPRA